MGFEVMQTWGQILALSLGNLVCLGLGFPACRIPTSKQFEGSRRPWGEEGLPCLPFQHLPSTAEDLKPTAGRFIQKGRRASDP